MNITITQAHLARAHNAVGQAPEAVADLVESEATPAIGVFPTNLVEEPWRAHHLSGEAGDDAALEDVAVVPVRELDGVVSRQAGASTSRSRSRARGDRARKGQAERGGVTKKHKRKHLAVLSGLTPHLTGERPVDALAESDLPGAGALGGHRTARADLSRVRALERRRRARRTTTTSAASGPAAAPNSETLTMQQRTADSRTTRRRAGTSRSARLHGVSSCGRSRSRSRRHDQAQWQVLHPGDPRRDGTRRHRRQDRRAPVRQQRAAAAGLRAHGAWQGRRRQHASLLTSVTRKTSWRSSHERQHR